MAKKKKAAEDDGRSSLSFEEALEKLEQIVTELEDGRLGLDESLARYEQGVSHLTQCHQLLQNAERKIALLSGVDEQGNPLTAPFDDDEEMSLEQKAEARARRRSRPADPDNHAAEASSGSGEPSDVDEYRGLF